MTTSLEAKLEKMRVFPTEYEEQCTFIDWLEMKGLKFSAIPNATYTPSYNQKRRNHFSGLRPGLPDLLVVIPPREGLAMSNLAFIEMKRTKGGVVSKEQKEWVETLNGCLGVEARVCKGAQEAIDFIEELL